MRTLLRALALLSALTLPAGAQTPPFRPCPYVTGGWSLPPQPPVTTVLYDTTTALLYVVLSGQTHLFTNVPPSTMQAFSNARNYQQFYATSVVNAYHEALLNEQTFCPILWEPTGAYFWAR